jgi:polysaccharide export outer membrane protein
MKTWFLCKLRWVTASSPARGVAGGSNPSWAAQPPGKNRRRGPSALLGLGLLLGLTACNSPRLAPLPPEVQRPYARVELREGDVIRITFPGAPSLNVVQQVRQDGKITLDQVGEIAVAGMTPAALEAEILRLYDQRLVTKQVMVTVESAAYPVYVSGAVLRPGKVMANRPMTIVEAIMEAGGFDENRAKSTAVVVTREVDGVTRSYQLDVKAMIRGRSTTRFYVRPNDVIYVPSLAW